MPRSNSLFTFSFTALLYGVNSVVLTCGVVVILTGYHVSMDRAFRPEPLPNYVVNPSNTFKTIGFSILLTSILGYFGNVKRSSNIIVIYGSLLLIIVAVEIVLGIWCRNHKYGVAKTIPTVLRESFNKYVLNETKDYDDIQHNFKCCGVKGKKDYSQLSLPVPVSCCRYNNALRDDKPLNCEVWNDGCIDNVINKIQSSFTEISNISFDCAILEMLAVILALCFRNNIEKEEGDRPLLN